MTCASAAAAAFAAALLCVGTADARFAALLRTVQVKTCGSGDAQENEN